MTDYAGEEESLLHQLKAHSAIAAPTGAYVVAKKRRVEGDGSDTIGESIGPKRVATDPSEIVAEFGAAKPANLTVYCQLFWPIYRDADMLTKLDRACAAQLASAPAANDKFQVRLLPTLARIHALGSGGIRERSEHEAFIVSSHYDARESPLSSNPSGISKDRDILEFIWRGSTCSLIRNDFAWSTFTVSQAVIVEADTVVRQYISGEDILFAPAMAAWQFLLTYFCALRERGEKQSVSIWNIIERNSTHGPDERLIWLRTMRELYHGRDLQNICPQFSEVFMACKFDVFDEKAKTFAILYTLGKIYANSLTFQKATPFVSTTRANEMNVWPEVCGRFGFGPTEWHKFKESNPSLNLFFSKKAVRYIDDGFANGLGPKPNAAAELSEQIRATNLGLWAPFPNSWISAGRRVGNAGKLLASGETFFIYLCQVLAVWAVMREPRRLALWFLLAIATWGVTALALVVPDVGALYRLRYAFWVMVMVMAMTVVDKLLASVVERRRMRQQYLGRRSLQIS